MACNFRIAAESAVFGQPEIKLGIIPGFGGTQRLPRLVGDEKALEMNLIGDAISAGEAEAYGLANRVVPDHELFDTALSWARRLAGQAPIAVEQVKLASDDPDLDEGIEKEKKGFRDRVHAARTRKEGISAFLGKRDAEVAGEVSAAGRGAARRRARLADPRVPISVVGADRRRDLGALRDPRLPHARARGCGRRSTRWRSPTSTPSIATRGASGASTGRGSPSSTRSSRTRAHEALAELERRGLLDAIVTQNIDRLHSKAGSERVIEVHGSIATSSCTTCRTSYPLENVGELFDPDGVATCACCMGKVKPDVVLFGELLPEAGDGRGRSALRRRRPAALRRLLARGLPGRRPAGAHPRRPAAGSRSSPRARPPTTPRPP